MERSCQFVNTLLALQWWWTSLQQGAHGFVSTMFLCILSSPDAAAAMNAWPS